MNWTIRYKICGFIFAASQNQSNRPAGQAGLAEHLRGQSRSDRCSSPSILPAQLVHNLIPKGLREYGTLV
jgi:hypothetical protein